MPMSSEIVKSTLQTLSGSWMRIIGAAMDYKNACFGNQAREAMAYYDGTYDIKDFYNTTVSSYGVPPVQMRFNKVAEVVQLFGPVLYHDNPTRVLTSMSYPELPAADLANALMPPEMIDRMMQAASMTGMPIEQAQMLLNQYAMSATQNDLARYNMERHRTDSKNKIISILGGKYLNNTPYENDLRRNSHMCIDEAIVKGMGTIWCLSGGTEIYARYENRHTVCRIRDLFRSWQNAEVWDGIAWRKIRAASVRERDGTELKITLRSGESFNCSTIHRWPTKRGVVMASELKVGDSISNTMLPSQAVLEPEFVPDEVGWFVGLVLGDGWIVADKRDVAIGVACHIDDTETIAKINRFAASYGGKITWKQQSHKGTKATIYCRTLVAILREFIDGNGCFEKRLSASCWNRSNRFLSNVLDGYLDADGHFVEAEESWRLHFCNNKQLASSLRTLTARLGLRMSLKLVEEGDNKNYQGSIRTRPPIKGGVDLQSIVAIEPADHRCDLYYDITVDSDSHLFALASGTLTHNCDVHVEPITGQKMVGSFWDNTDNYLHDPDYNLRDDDSCKWKARLCIEPVWMVEKKYGWAPGSLTPNLTSMTGATMPNDPRNNRPQQLNCDLIAYWMIWSKMGVGDRLPGMDPGMRARFGQYGDYVYLVVAQGVDTFLNLPPSFVETATDQQIQQAIQWPVPYYGDNGWPVTCLSFHRNFRANYPLSHIRFAIGEIQFMNWVVSMIATKLQTTSRDILIVSQSVGDEIEAALKSGGDLTMAKIKSSSGRSIGDLAKFFQAPPMNTDIMQVIPMIMDMLDKRLGTNALLYGDSNGIFRSASEAEIKNTNSRSRIDSMAKEVNAMSAAVAYKEFIAARTVLGPQDLAPILGNEGTNLWGRLIANADPTTIFRQIQVRIEESSTRPPNREKLAANAETAMQQLAPLMASYASATGDYGPLNSAIQQFATSLDMDSGMFTLKPPMMPPMNGAPMAEGSGTGQPPASLPDMMPVGTSTG